MIFFLLILVTGNEEFLTISLNKNDRIRLIHAPDNVIATVEETVRLNWGKGIQQVSDKRPALFEIKLRGYPWWADGMIVETAQKMKFSIKDFFSKCDQIWSHLLKTSLMENFIFCEV